MGSIEGSSLKNETRSNDPEDEFKVDEGVASKSGMGPAAFGPPRACSYRMKLAKFQSIFRKLTEGRN